MALTETRKDLLAALCQIQNHPACVNQDIMTFTGFMNDDEVRAHIERYISVVADYNFERANEAPRSRKRKVA